MALVKCPDCKKKISNTAPSCPHCGHVLTTEERKVKSSFTKKIFKVLLGIVAVIVAFGLIKGMMQSPEEKARIKAGNAEYQERKAQERAQAAKDKIANLPRVSAVQLSRDFSNNEVAANRQYKGKEMLITGVVAEISTTLTGAPQINLNGTGILQMVFAELERDHADTAATLRKGTNISLQCTVEGYVLSNVMADDCIILK